MKNHGIEYMHGSYVYYQRLLTDAYDNYSLMPLALEAKNSLNYTLQELQDFTFFGDYFKKLSDEELIKEKRLLQSKFKGLDILKNLEIDGNYTLNSNYASNLIKAVNYIMGIKKVFERNVLLIQNTNGQKNLMTFFPKYFREVWKEDTKIILEDIKKQKNIYQDNNIDFSYENMIKARLDEYLPDMVKKALLKMFKDTDVENGLKKEYSEYKDAYEDLAFALETNPYNEVNRNFIDALIKTYDMRAIAEYSAKKTAKTLTEEDLKKRPPDITSSMHTRGGITMEYFRVWMQNVLYMGMDPKGENYTLEGKGIHAGHRNIKPDAITVYGADVQPVQDWLNDSDFGGRVKDVIAAKKLQEYLRNFDDGFIVYTNSKNYSLNNNFKNTFITKDGKIKLGGFSAGSDITLDTLDHILSIMGLRNVKLIRAAMQVIPGAIGENYKDKISESFSILISQALFDDFNQIGVSTDNNSIHLLDLNGVLTPLSFYFWLLSNAFYNVGNYSVDELVQVNIKTPENIEYPEPLNGVNWWGYDRWIKQRDIALKEIKVGFAFFQNFKQVLKDFVQI